MDMGYGYRLQGPSSEYMDMTWGTGYGVQRPSSAYTEWGMGYW